MRWPGLLPASRPRYERSAIPGKTPEKPHPIGLPLLHSSSWFHAVDACPFQDSPHEAFGNIPIAVDGDRHAPASVLDHDMVAPSDPIQYPAVLIHDLHQLLACHNRIIQPMSCMLTTVFMWTIRFSHRGPHYDTRWVRCPQQPRRRGTGYAPSQSRTAGQYRRASGSIPA